jgi:hypothetical protein
MGTRFPVTRHNKQSDDSEPGQTTRDAREQVARWQSKYGRDPTVTDRQRSWLVNKVRTDIAMMGTKLRVNARVIIKNFLNLQNTH